MKWRSVQRDAAAATWNRSGVEILYGRLPTTLRGAGKVETQRIGLVHRQAVDGVTLAQAPAQVPVELHDVEVLDPLEQRGRQRTESGADFNEVLAPVRIDCGDDVLDDPPVDEKMLTESFSRDMPTGRHCLAG